MHHLCVKKCLDQPMVGRGCGFIQGPGDEAGEVVAIGVQGGEGPRPGNGVRETR